MASSQSQNEPIAIVGSGCRFPGGASSPSKLWDLLSRPRDILTPIPPARFEARGFYHEDGEYSGHSNVLQSYLISEDHTAWDADFFNVAAGEASAVDPQQRLLMECVYEALETGGHRIEKLRGSDTAVFVGLVCEEYSDIHYRELNAIPRYFPTGTARSIASNRVSYFFDWHGPSMTIDTACSSSLVAVHQAVQTLRSGQSQVAVAAGAQLILGPEPYIVESTFHMLSPSGRCHMWDASADGYGRGDGIAAVVLKRLSQAVADGDAIDCVIREIGVNQDGRTGGITVPSAEAQIALIRDTYRRAGLDLALERDRPQLFECHGTGTPTGDPIEAEAIHRSMGQHIVNSGGPDLFVGSIKTVLGHTEATAGIAGLLKASLALQEGFVPPNMLFERLHPAIVPFYPGLRVHVGDAIPWPPVGDGQPRRVSVNSFGFGGTNAHAVVESYHHPDVQHAKTEGQRQEHMIPAYPFTFSAASKGCLRRMLGDTIAFLAAQEERSGGQVSARDLAWTLNSRRSVFPVRAVFAARGPRDLKHRIQHAINDDAWEPTSVISSSSSNGNGITTGILGVFTGQGAQWAGMGRRLLQDIPLASQRLSELEAALSNLPDPADRPSWSLCQELTKVEGSRVHMAEFAQPLCTALQIVLVDLLAGVGIRFAAVVGHSSGEIGAAYAAGVLSARDALVVAYFRGIHSSRDARGTKKGAMMAVGTSPSEAAELVFGPQFKGRISVAAHNSPTSVTLSGDEDAIQAAQALFAGEGKFTRILRVEQAYHSHHMNPCLEPYVESVRRAGVRAMRPPDASCTWYSSVFGASGDSISSASDGHVLRLLDGEYWALNMAQTVLFSEAVEAAVVCETARGCSFSMAVEVGPHGALRGPLQDTLAVATAGAATAAANTNKNQPLPYASCLTRDTDDSVSFSRAIGHVWAHDNSTALVDLARFQTTIEPTSPLPRPARNLPTYPWDHQRTFWHESRRSRALRLRTKPAHPLLGTPSPDSTATDLLWHNLLRIPDLPWLHGHRLQGQIIFPAAAYMSAAVEAALQAAGAARPTAVKKVELRNVHIGKAIAFEDESASGCVEMLTSLHVVDDHHYDEHVLEAQFCFRSVVMGTEATDADLNASGRVVVYFPGDGEEAEETLLAPQQEDEAPARMIDVGADHFYSALGALGYHYSSSFRSLTAMKRRLNHARARLAVPAPGEMHRSETALVLHPGPLDALFQAVFLAYHWPGDGRLWSMHVPVSIDRIQIDVAQCHRSSDAGQHLRIESDVTMDPSVSGYQSVRDGIGGDVTIFSGDGTRGLVQAEGVLLAPLAAAPPADDVQMFLQNVTGVAFPDCHLAMTTTLGAQYRASEQETELGWALERISHFYLARLAQDITPEEEARAQWHHQRLLAFARYTTARLREGKQPYGRAEWARDALDPSALHKLMEEHGHTIDVRLMRAVGENLGAAVRGKTVMLQHMMQDGMLERSYVETLGVALYTDVLSATVEQITHVYPQLRVLEVGAGTGGATKSILRRLHAARVGHYTFTDISSGFFEAAEALFPGYVEGGRMSFRTLDLERDPVEEQGFEEHAFDLIVASFVLHATRDLDRTLRHVRRLLRPGGFLVMLEMTSNDPIRLCLQMGGLEGWWSGADSGRPWSPCVSAVQWHQLLLRNGFSGVETSTPDHDTLPRPFGVLVSRACDHRLKTLLAPSLEPAPSTDEDPCSVAELLIVAGSEPPSIRFAERVSRILRPYCRAPITTLSGWCEMLQLDASSIKRPLTVLCLADLDERPLIEGIGRDTFEGLKKLFALSPDEMLWVTRGAQTGERPYATASIGLGRAMMMEETRTALQFLDFAVAAEPDVRLVADDLLRLHIVHAQEQRTDDSTSSTPPPLWSRETEVTIDSQGRRRVSRILPHQVFNSSYNSARRTILSSLVDPTSDDIQIQDECGKEDEADGQPSPRSVVRVRHVESRHGPTATIRIRPSYSAPLAVQEDWQRGTSRTWTVSIGVKTSSSTPGGGYATAFCLSDSLGSIVTPVSAESLVPWDDDHVSLGVDALSCLGAVARYLVASLICRAHEAEQRNYGKGRSNTTLLLDPDAALAQEVTSSQLNIVCLTSSPAKQASSPAGLYTLIDTNTSSRAVRQALTCLGSPIRTVIICSDATTRGRGGYRLARLLQSSSGELRAARTRLVGDLLGEARHQHHDGDENCTILDGLFREAVGRCCRGLVDSIKLPDVDMISLRDYADKQRSLVTRTAVIDWSAACHPELFVTARPLDGMHPLLRSDRTYLLLGLAGSGGLGLSLVEYLARQGACYFVLTSRHPSVDEKLVMNLARRGVRIQVLAQDVTHEPSLRKLVADLDESPDWPPIAGVANGAMVLADATLQNMTLEQMTRVLRPKVEGTRIVDRVFHDEALDFFVLFSSLSCVLGNSGQANYDAANMYLVGLAANRRARGLAASVVDIGAIMGTGYMAREVSDRTLAQMVGAGFRKMSERDFLVVFANGMMAGCCPSEESELITGLHVPAPGDEFQPAWVNNPRFSHVVAASLVDAGQTLANASSSYAESARDLLKRARTSADVSRIISAFTLRKISHMLQLSAEATSDQVALLQRSTASLGVDSLMAVEVRSWLMKEFDVEIAVFKILANITIRDLQDLAAEALPERLTPNLDRNSTDDAVPAEDLAGSPETGQDARVSKKQKQRLQQQSLPRRENAPPTGQDAPQAPPPASKINETFDKVRTDRTDGTSIPAGPGSLTTPTAEAGLSSGPGSSLTCRSREPPSPPSLMQNTTTAQRGADIEKIRPMSYGQSRFWIMSQMVPDQCAFNVTNDIEITAEIDKLALSQAVRSLGARHEALRTCFIRDADSDQQDTAQAIMADSTLHLEMVQASSPSEVEKHFLDLHKTTYDMDKGRLMRMVLVSVSPIEHHLLLGYHHINMDSSSTAILMSELSRLYAGQELPPPQVQQADLALHERERLRGGHWAEQIAFWQRELTKATPDPLPLLAISPETYNKARPERSMAAYRSHSHHTRVPARTAQQVQDLCRKVGVTPFHLYVTGFQVLLARLARVDHVCIGMADANRRADLSGAAEECVGNFLNLVPLVLETDLGQSVEYMARQTSKKVLQAMSNAAVPFEIILEQCAQPQRRGEGHSPLFQAFVDYKKVYEKLEIPNAKGHLEGRRYLLSNTPYDIMLDIIDGPTGEAALELRVQDGLYTSEEARRLLECYMILMRAFAESGGQVKTGEASIFDPHEVEDALRLGQGELMKLDSKSLLPRLDAVAADQALARANALEDSTGTSLIWPDMISKSVAIAGALQRQGVPARSRVAMFQDPTVDWVCTMLGIWRAGCSYVPLELTQGLRRLGDIAGAAHVVAVVVHDATLPLVSQLGLERMVHIVNVSNLQHSAGFQQAMGGREVEAEDEAMVLYTSGSTGVPKGISIPHRVVVNAIQGMLRRWPSLETSPQAVLQQAALGFDLSWFTALLGLATRGKVVVAGREARGDPRALTQMIVRYAITFTFATPGETIAWLESGERADLRSGSWCWHIAAGEPIPLSLLRHLRELNKPSLRVVNAFGPTEAWMPLAHEVSYQDDGFDKRWAVPAGRVMPNYTVRIMDAQGNALPEGVPGHLVFGGAGIAHGYVDGPELTTQRFPVVDDRWAAPEFLAQQWNKAHLSGDCGYLRASDGVFMACGRIDGDTQVKLRGQRVDLCDVESNIVAAAEGHIIQALVSVRKPLGASPPSTSSSSPSTAEPEADGDGSARLLVAHVVLTSDANSRYANRSDAAVFLRRIVEKLPVPDYMRPTVIEAVDALPLTPNGKLDRKAVAAWPVDPMSMACIVPSRQQDAADMHVVNGSASERKANGSAAAVAATTSQGTRGSTEKMKHLWLRVLRSAADPGTLGPDSDFFHVGGNSLLLMSVQTAVRRRYGVDVRLAHLFQRSKLGEMASILDTTKSAEPSTSRGAERDAASTAPSETSIDWEPEIQALPEIAMVSRLDGNDLPICKATISRSGRLVVALTGATGFIGRRILKHLLDEPKVKEVHCLAVRNPAALDAYGTAAIGTGTTLVVHPGDLSWANLGIQDDSVLASVFGAADAIIHNGADTSFLKSYATLRPTNVQSTRDLVSLTLRYRVLEPRNGIARPPAHVHFVSTGGVSTFLGRNLGEEPLGQIPHAHITDEGYLLTKWAMELFLERAAAASRGLVRATIHRPTAAYGPGAPALDIIASVLRYSELLRTVPALSALEGTFQFVPVDEVARDIVASVLHDGSDDGGDDKAVRYHNHCGGPEGAVDLRRLGAFLGSKMGRSEPLPVLEDEDWLVRAEGVGMPVLVVEYLRAIESPGGRDHKRKFTILLKTEKL